MSVKNGSSLKIIIVTDFWLKPPSPAWIGSAMPASVSLSLITISLKKSGRTSTPKQGYGSWNESPTSNSIPRLPTSFSVGNSIRSSYSKRSKPLPQSEETKLPPRLFVFRSSIFQKSLPLTTELAPKFEASFESSTPYEA